MALAAELGGAIAEDWLGKWAMNLMLINVSTRKFRRAVRLPEGDVPAPTGAGVSKSAASRHFVALSAARMKEWMGADLSGLDIMVVQIDGIHISEHLVLVAALGIDSEGFKHPLGLMEGATEHSAVVQALIDDLIERGLDPAVPRLFIIDGSKALSKAIRCSFGCHTPIQRCQIHKAPTWLAAARQVSPANSEPSQHSGSPARIAPLAAAAMTHRTSSACLVPASAAALIRIVSPGIGMPELSSMTTKNTAA